jgi:hypothetical protein
MKNGTKSLMKQKTPQYSTDSKAKFPQKNPERNSVISGHDWNWGEAT